MVKKLFVIDGVEAGWGYVDLDGKSFDQPVLYIDAYNHPVDRGGRYPFIYTEEPEIKRVKLSLLALLKEQHVRFYGVKNVTFRYWITTEPKSLDECIEQLVGLTLGMPDVHWYHSYSDLTGYLWTSTTFKAKDSEGKGHDLLKEFSSQLNEYKPKHPDRKYKHSSMEEQVPVKKFLTLEIKEH